MKPQKLTHFSKTRILLAGLLVFMFAAVTFISCSKQEEKPIAKSADDISQTKVIRKSGGGSQACYTGMVTVPACCPGPILVEICGWELRDANNKVIEFTINSVRQITGTCLQGCPPTEIFNAAKKAMVLFILDGEHLLQPEDEEYESYYCIFQGTKSYKIRTPLCVKQDPIYQGLKLLTCNPNAYCESTILAACNNGVLSVQSDPNNPPVTTGSCSPQQMQQCQPVACIP